jgi:hypothetical protein
MPFTETMLRELVENHRLRNILIDEIQATRILIIEGDTEKLTLQEYLGNLENLIYRARNLEIKIDEMTEGVDG